jgi:hypothetical protein
MIALRVRAVVLLFVSHAAERIPLTGAVSR